MNFDLNLTDLQKRENGMFIGVPVRVDVNALLCRADTGLRPGSRLPLLSTLNTASPSLMWPVMP